VVTKRQNVYGKLDDEIRKTQEKEAMAKALAKKNKIREPTPAEPTVEKPSEEAEQLPEETAASKEESEEQTAEDQPEETTEDP
jgi:hypothetical protein